MDTAMVWEWLQDLSLSNGFQRSVAESILWLSTMYSWARVGRHTRADQFRGLKLSKSPKLTNSQQHHSVVTSLATISTSRWVVQYEVDLVELVQFIYTKLR